MIKVIFLNKFNEEKVIAETIDEMRGRAAIYNFLEEHNYKSYYWRYWQDETNTKRTIVDVGSHCEFFIMEEH
jgi:hypothetical protein